jgi:hypothetical protein
VDETGLFWKKLPSRTCISMEEQLAPGIQELIESAPWREHNRKSTIKVITGISVRNSQSNERHFKISFPSHLDFK